MGRPFKVSRLGRVYLIYDQFHVTEVVRATVLLPKTGSLVSYSTRRT